MSTLTLSKINDLLMIKNKYCRLLCANYVSSSKEMIFTDPKYGDFLAKVSKVLHSTKEHPLRTSEKRKRLKYTEEEFILALKEKSPYLKLVDGTYKGLDRTCTFIDEKYGEYRTRPYNVLKGHSHKLRSVEKRKATLKSKYNVEYYSQHKDFKSKITSTYLSRYNVEHNMKDPILALKNAKSNNKYIEISHWKTRTPVGCVASYEKATVEYFNKNKIDFLWQPKTFKYKTSTYRPDAYLPEKDLWIEIKGYFRGDSEEKWNWFHKEYPNSELWDTKKLKEMGIL